jgi:hypothetical protein
MQNNDLQFENNEIEIDSAAAEEPGGSKILPGC